MSAYGWLLELDNTPEMNAPGLDKYHTFEHEHEHVLLIDHHDSFTYLIKSYFEQLGASVTVVQYTDTALDDLDAWNPTRLVLSPGPGSPREVYTTQQLILKHYKHYPMLGICLGHQCMIEAFGGRIIQAGEIHHGKQSVIEHDGQGLFLDLPRSFLATRYHSLVMDEHALPHDWKMTAWAYDKAGCRVVMGVAHCHYPLFGVQYHPEAILTEHGMQVLRNFLFKTPADQSQPLL
ncbi:MAG: aminodeoxychorismate/anthranilate synthase component II [Legionellaceae bacterium]|nr:aminodeoxychorismate/anthranilate synthase component II [Legionellaceae bacterium]